jgi:hypothetical protein
MEKEPCDCGHPNFYINMDSDYIYVRCNNCDKLFTKINRDLEG